MKVIILAPTPPPAGGIAGWTERMKSASLKNGWKVEVVDEKLIGKREVFGEKNRRSIIVEAKRCIGIWSRLFKALKCEEAMIVHSCIPATTTAMMREYICAILTKLKGRKFIIHYRCTVPNMIKSKIGLFMFKVLTNKSDLAMVLNTQSVEFVERYSKTNSVLVPNFIETNSIIEENSKPINDKVKTILYVGGVIESKGCCNIIEVAREFPEIQFRLVGKVEEKIKNVKRTDNIILLGEKSKSEVKKEMEQADIFMFVTYFSGEGFSNALAEAMANGLPCVVTDWAANRDMIEDKGGIVVQVKNTKLMVAAINRLKQDYELRKAQSQWNIKKVKLHYSDRIITEIYVDEYEKIIKGV